MTPNLFNLKKAHWNDLGNGLIRSKNGNHAIWNKGENYFEWDFDILPEETPEQNTLKDRNREEEFNAWKNKMEEVNAN